MTASWVATICVASIGFNDVAGADVRDRRRVARLRISLVSGSSLLPRQIVPSAWLAA